MARPSTEERAIFRGNCRFGDNAGTTESLDTDVVMGSNLRSRIGTASGLSSVRHS
jgi:hypothetical protein